jgi:predicted metalloendopeptidase
MGTKKNKKNTNKHTRKKTRTKTSSNFYGVVNSKWFNKTKIKDDRVSINEYNILQDKVDRQLQKIVSSLRGNSNINNLYLSFNKFNKTKDNVELEVKKVVSLLDVMRKDKNNLWRYLAYCSKYRINHPFYWALTIDQKNINKHVCLIGENGLGLNDKGHYTKRGKYIEIREEYLKYIEKCFVLLMGENHNCKAEDVLKIETFLSKYTRNEIENRDPKLTYNSFSVKSLNDIGFNSYDFLKKLGYTKYPPVIIVSNPKYIKETCKYLKNWTDDSWYSYWIFKIFNSYARFHEVWRNHEFDFYENFLMGQNKIISPEKFAFKHGVSTIMNTTLTERYMKEHNNIKNINYCHELFKKIKSVFRKRLEHNCWLSPETKELAIKKLENMKLHCGLKKKFIKDPNITFKETNPIYNYLEYRKWYIKNQIHKNFKEVDNDEWDRFDSENVFDVNAYYFPLMNQIIIPNAILQKPFLDHTKNMAYNLAYIGSTISHEMIHAFDDEGSKYDYKGEYKNWWTHEDKKTYKLKQKSVISQYELYAKKLENFKLSGEHSLGENIADIGGLAIAEETLIEYLRECGRDEINIDDHLKMFYVYYCQQWRTKIKIQAKHELSATDEHVNPKYRANMSLSRCQNFIRLFNIKKGDLMYWYDSDQIW